MSVSDPLIKDIKGYVSKFLEDSQTAGYITDENINLVPFCEHLETIFNTGIISSQNTLGFTKVCDVWNCFQRISSIKDDSINFEYSNSIDNVQRYKNILTPLGKFRLLVRWCLVKKSLYIPVSLLIKDENRNLFYHHSSILGDEILSEIFLSVLLQCSKLNFKLDLNNVAFLDITWILPEIQKLEVVPCSSLGISVSFVNNKAIIVDITSNSVLQECHNVEVGDVLYNLNNVPICSAMKGKLHSILKCSKGKPIALTIVKAKSGKNDKLYQPIIQLLKQARLNLDVLKNNEKLSSQFSHMQLSGKTNKSAGFLVRYEGFVIIGKVGDVGQISKSIKSLISYSSYYNSNCKHIKKLVRFEIGEIGVKIIDDSSDVLLKHSYMEISSCGSVLHKPYFAYIAGNEYCDRATNFTCYVFYTKNYDMVHTILQSIGQGFQRTHFAV